MTQSGHQAITPNKRPTTAVNAIARAPQKVTLIAPTVIDAPPADDLLNELRLGLTESGKKSGSRNFGCRRPWMKAYRILNVAKVRISSGNSDWRGRDAY